MRVLRWRLAVAGPIVALLAICAPAQAAWSPLGPLSDPNNGGFATNSVVGADDGFRSFYEWEQSGDVHLRIRSATGTLGSDTSLSADGVSSTARMVVAQNGYATFAWVSGGRVTVRIRTPAGTLTAPALVSFAGRNASDVRLATDKVGNALIVWQSFDGTNQRIYGRWRKTNNTYTST